MLIIKFLHIYSAIHIYPVKQKIFIYLTRITTSQRLIVEIIIGVFEIIICKCIAIFKLESAENPTRSRTRRSFKNIVLYPIYG